MRAESICLISDRGHNLRADYLPGKLIVCPTKLLQVTNDIAFALK